MKKTYFVLIALMVLSCSLFKKPEVKTSVEDPNSWRKRGIWTEQKGDKTMVMVVGLTGNATLDESMARDKAEQDARERMAIYLGATVQAFRERMARQREIKAKRDGVASSAVELTEQTDRGGRTVADQAVAGLEIVNSYVDKETDTMYVLGRLDIESLRKVLAQDKSLTEEERKLVSQNSEEVKKEMDEALEQARQTPPK